MQNHRKLHVVRSARLARTDGIKSSEARRGWRGKLKFSIASTAPLILHSPVLTGTWQQDCSLSARVNALALCKPSIGKIDGHLTVTPPASGGAWRSMEKDSRDFVWQKHRPVSRGQNLISEWEKMSPLLPFRRWRCRSRENWICHAAEFLSCVIVTNWMVLAEKRNYFSI